MTQQYSSSKVIIVCIGASSSCPLTRWLIHLTNLKLRLVFNYSIKTKIDPIPILTYILVIVEAFSLRLRLVVLDVNTGTVLPLSKALSGWVSDWIDGWALLLGQLLGAATTRLSALLRALVALLGVVEGIGGCRWLGLPRGVSLLLGAVLDAAGAGVLPHLWLGRVAQLRRRRIQDGLLRLHEVEVLGRSLRIKRLVLRWIHEVLVHFLGLWFPLLIFGLTALFGRSVVLFIAYCGLLTRGFARCLIFLTLRLGLTSLLRVASGRWENDDVLSVLS